MITRWLGGENLNLMPTGYVAATYNVVENEIPKTIGRPFIFNANLNSYNTILPKDETTLKVFVDDVEVTYTINEDFNNTFRINSTNNGGLIRFFYNPINDEDYYGNSKLNINKLRTNIFERKIRINTNVINQIRASISQIETNTGNLKSKWINGLPNNATDTIEGDPNNIQSISSNLVKNKSISVVPIFTEIVDSIQKLANKLNIIIDKEQSDNFNINNNRIDVSWIEAVRTTINNIENQI